MFPLDATQRAALCVLAPFSHLSAGGKQDGEPASIDPHGAHGDGQAGGRLRRVRVGVQGLGESLARFCVGMAQGTTPTRGDGGGGLLLFLPEPNIFWRGTREVGC